MYTKISSAARTSGTPSSYTLYLNTPLSVGKYQLVSACIPNTFFNVNSTNNTVNWNENSSNKSVQITPGFYTAASLATQVASQMTTTSSGYNTYSSSISTITNYITISASSNFYFTFGTNTSKSLAPLLGFASSDGSGATQQSGTLVPNVNTVLSFCVNLSGSGISSEIRGSTGRLYTFDIPITGNSGSIINYEINSAFEQKLSIDSSVQTLNVSIQDDLGNSLTGLLDHYFLLKKS